MSTRSVLNAIALSAVLVVSILVFVTAAQVGLISVGVFGLLMWGICNRMELDAPVSVLQTSAFLARREQLRAGQRAEEHAASMAARLLSLQSIRFYRYLGAALSVIGLGGFALFQIQQANT
jgi:hypothetical protein